MYFLVIEFRDEKGSSLRITMIERCDWAQIAYLDACKLYPGMVRVFTGREFRPERENNLS